MLIENKVIVTGADMGADIFSPPIYCGQMAMGFIQAIWSGAPSGTIGLQGSGDRPPNNTKEDFTGAYVTNWDYIFPERATFTITASDGTAYWNIHQNPSKWLRIVFKHSAGIGTMQTIQYYARGV